MSSDYKMSCGKFKGETFGEVFANEKSYTDYILGLPLIEEKNFFKWYLVFLKKVRDDLEKDYNDEVEGLFKQDNRTLTFGGNTLNLYRTMSDGREIDYTEEEIDKLKRIIYVLSTDEFSPLKNCVYCEKIENNIKGSVRPCLYHKLKNEQTFFSKQNTYEFFKTMLKPQTEEENLFLRKCITRMVEDRC